MDTFESMQAGLRPPTFGVRLCHRDLWSHPIVRPESPSPIMSGSCTFSVLYFMWAQLPACFFCSSVFFYPINFPLLLSILLFLFLPSQSLPLSHTYLLPSFLLLSLPYLLPPSLSPILTYSLPLCLLPPSFFPSFLFFPFSEEFVFLSQQNLQALPWEILGKRNPR